MDAPSRVCAALQCCRQALHLIAIVAGGLAAGAHAQSSQPAAQWISSPDAPATAPVVVHFRRDLVLDAAPVAFPVRVSADNRFVLYVNGVRVAQGPARGDLAHWRYQRINLARFLKPGANVVAAEIWNAVTPAAEVPHRTSPFAQISARTGFWLEGEDVAAHAIDSGPTWRAAVQPGHTLSYPFESLVKPLGGLWYAAGAGEDIDGAIMNWDWAGPRETGAGWANAVAILTPTQPAPWHMEADTLPAMRYARVPFGRIARATIGSTRRFPDGPTVIPAHTDATILLDRGTMLAAYPALELSGGNGATITLTYTEAMYDAAGHKADRNAIAGRSAIGLQDVFHPDGGAHRVFQPLWWRVWRYCELHIKTTTQALRLERLTAHATGYPFIQKGFFHSNDAQINRIWRIGWRTVQIDTHETYMDSAYWEQLQYVGDSRIDADIVDAVAGDPRATRQAIDAFGSSTNSAGMIQSAYPSSTDNIIPTFGLLWIGMLHDYWMHQPDTAVLVRNLPTARKIIAWYAHNAAPNGLLIRGSGWNFVDWVGDPPLARHIFPSFDRASRTSCLTSLMLLGAVQDAADLEKTLGDPPRAEQDRAGATALRAAIEAKCWDSARGLYADDPSRTIFSQHTNALAVLYDVAPADRAAAVIDRIIDGQGIDAKAGVLPVSPYFAWYLVRAMQHAGRGDRYIGLLSTWRMFDRQHFTTWPESFGNTRSDTHAWSAHPTADLLGIVAGIQPASAGYRTVVIAPHPCGLRRFNAGAMTPYGLVRVGYRNQGRSATLSLVLPPHLSGRLVWRGRTIALHQGIRRLRIRNNYISDIE